jgi:Xaa-Pro aminopeptidase
MSPELPPIDFAARRSRLLEALPPRTVAVFPSQPVAHRNHDVEHAYRQHSDLYYLTGLDEPDCALVLGNVHPEHRAVLFLRPKDPLKETWDGSRVGVEAAPERLGVDLAFAIEDFEKEVPAYLADSDQVVYQPGPDRAFDDRLFAALGRTRRLHRKGRSYPTALLDPERYLHPQRLVKGPEELARMRRAVAITAEAHAAARAIAAPGVHEYEVEAELHRVFRRRGSERPAYSSIVGSGPNATILHYRQNARRMEDGDLLLIDAGAEYGYYAADVTRTFAIGASTEAQRSLHGLVLEVQRAAVASVRPGVRVDDIHHGVVRGLTEGLIHLGLLEGSVDEAIEERTFERFYMHRTSHWLGMDVHDVGTYYIEGASTPLEAGHVLTIEPGLYVSPTMEGVDDAWRGLGVRIEDDVLVTAEGHENLSVAIPAEL